MNDDDTAEQAASLRARFERFRQMPLEQVAAQDDFPSTPEELASIPHGLWGVVTTEGAPDLRGS